MARSIAFKSGTTKISKPHTQLTIGILSFLAVNLLLQPWPLLKLISWTFFVIPTHLGISNFIVPRKATLYLFASNINRCSILATVTTIFRDAINYVIYVVFNLQLRLNMQFSIKEIIV